MNKIKLFSILSSPFLFIACGDIEVRPNDSATYMSFDSGIEFCTTPAELIKSNVKFIFVMDRSGSNYQRPSIGADGTDPSGALRFNPMSRFVQSFENDVSSDFIYWSLVEFNSNANIRQAESGADFTNNNLSFQNLINQRRPQVDANGVVTSTQDTGATNYLQALTTVRSMIERDIQRSSRQDPKISSNYIIFFISDGAPLVLDSNTNTNVLQDPNDILQNVRNLMTLQEANKELVEGIIINTGFYTNNSGAVQDPNNDIAIELLSNMAKEGGDGRADRFNDGQEIDFVRFSVPERLDRYSLKEFWVQNANTLWVGNKLLIDTDMDGLADQLEIELGSNPFDSDSDGDGISDGVRYFLTNKTQACVNGNCNSQAPADPACVTLRPLTQNKITYADSDRDYLNDCEEMALKLSRDNADSNADFIPDWIAFRNQITMNSNSTVDLYSDSDFDNLNNYNEIKKNTPVYWNNAEVPGLVEMSTQGKRVSSTEIQDCYSYNVFNMAFTGHRNNIRVFILESTRQGKVKFRTSEKNIPANTSLRFSDSEIQ